MLRHSIPTTSPVRTLLDLGAVDRRGVRPALEAMLAANLVDLTAVRSAIIRHSKRGRRGIVSIRRACEEINIDGVASDSRLEVVMRRLLAQFRLPPALFHARIEGYEVDFWIVDTPVIIECDGWQYHGLNRDQFELDRARDAALLAAGYVVVRVTWRQLHDEPAAVARRLRGVLATWHTAA
jgi:very-short-patch-repair endonuclease